MLSLGKSLALTVASLLLGAAASASTITLSTNSSDETNADFLDATYEFSVIGGNTLELIVTNDTTAPDLFNINQVYFNASSGVSSLALTSATHSVEGNVLGDWAPVDTNVMVDGFGVFDFGLTDGTGETDPSVVGPTESITFLFDITGSCATGLSCTMDDFATPNAKGYTAAAKFVNGPGDDSAFGAVPEPGTALLLGLGLVALGARRRA